MDVITHNIAPFLFVLVVLVVIHELGHYLTAKLFGIKVLEFGIGYPPKLFGKMFGETEYTINVLPLGGFVRLLGEEDPTEPRSLASQPAPQRLIVMGAGSFMNFVLAITLFSVALMIPREVSVGQATIAQVVPGSPADIAGLKTGDTILSIGGRKVESVPDASYDIRLNLGEKTAIKVLRTDPVTGQSQEKTVEVKPRWAPPAFNYTVQPGDDVNSVARATTYDRTAVLTAAGINTKLPVGKELTITASDGEISKHTIQEGETIDSIATAMRVTEDQVAEAAGVPTQATLTPGQVLHFQQGATGIQIAPKNPFTETRSLGPWPAFKKGWQSTFDSLKLARNEVISWLKGGSKAPVSGPIGIAQATGEIVKEAGWKSLVDLAALLSINLAILNILPLPMLDGGRMAFVVIEILRRGKRIAPAKEAMVHLVGMAAMLVLVVVLSYFDIARIITGGSMFR